MPDKLGEGGRCVHDPGLRLALRYRSKAPWINQARPLENASAIVFLSRVKVCFIARYANGMKTIPVTSTIAGGSANRMIPGTAPQATATAIALLHEGFIPRSIGSMLG